jgi:protein SCO1/2
MIALAGCGTDSDKAGEAATEQPAASEVQSGFRGSEFSPPIPAADFDLIDHNGNPIHMSDFKGKLVLMSFAYTSCPDVCPILFGYFKEVQEAFAAQIGEDIVLLLVSVDPEVDTPERLAEHTAVIGGRWHFVTGDLDGMQKLWSDYQVRVEKEETGPFVGHSNITYLIDRDGLLRLRFPGATPGSVVAADIQMLLDGAF